MDAEILGEAGSLSPTSYPSPNLTSTNAKMTITNYALAPGLRVHSSGSLRALAGVAVGLEGQATSAELGYINSAGTGTKTVSGSALAGMFLFEAGGQIDLGRVFLEAVAFVDVHGVGSAEDASSARLFLDSPSVRGGGRVLLGYAF